MALTRLTLTVDEDVIRRVRAYCKAHNTSISRLVNGFLAGLAAPGQQDLHPIVKRLVGILPEDTDESDYHRHLEDKYLS